MDRSLRTVLFGTFTLRFSTGLTGALLSYYLADLSSYGGKAVDPIVVGVFAASFFAAELILSPPLGAFSDRFGHHRMMQVGPVFGAVAVTLTWLSTNLVLIGLTRFLEGASTAASVPSILGFIAMVTAGDELLRGRASAGFEGATLAGLGLGLVAAGLLYEGVGPIPGLGRNAFLLNAFFYLGSLLIYRYGVTEPPEEAARRSESQPGVRRYLGIIRDAQVWLLAPTWIAINAALGVWTSQSLFQLVRAPKPGFERQLLMGGFTPAQVSVGLAFALVVFFAGLAFWGNRFKRLPRTRIILYGIVGGAGLVGAGILLNHSGGAPGLLQAGLVFLAGAGLFVLAGATPAALGLLADMSEGFPADRGAIMGLYSVFLAIGQIAGSLLGGVAAQLRGIDGMFILTLILLGVAVIPIRRLREVELPVGESAAASG